MISTSKLKTRHQVFLSYAASDRDLANRVANELQDAGLRVVSMDDVEPRGEYSDSVRKALNLSDAVVTVLSKVSNRDQLPASVLFEIGAAVGAHKPIFVVLDDMTVKFPFVATHLKILPLTRVGEIAAMLDD